MFNKKHPGVFTTDDFESITQNLNKKEFELLISLVQLKVKNSYSRGDKINLNDQYNNYLTCPKCGNSTLNKNGITNNRQRYICKNCRTTFDERSFTPLSNTKLGLDKWLNYCRFMIEGGTIKYCAEQVSVSIPTSFFMRHRILDILNLSLRNQTFEGIVCADEYNLNESFKGKSPKKSIDEERYFHNFEYSNLSQCVGWTFRNSNRLVKSPEKYVKPVQAKINTAIDKNGHVLTRIIENSYFKTSFLKSCNKVKYQNKLLYNITKYQNIVSNNNTNHKNILSNNNIIYHNVTSDNNIKYHNILSDNDKRYQDILTYDDIKYQDMLFFFDGRLDKNATLCAFKGDLYRDVARKLNIKFKKANSRMSAPVYSVHHVFMYHIKLSHWLSNFHGVATKYLNNYLSWHCFLFMLQKYRGIKILNDLFIQLSTKNLAITKQQIQNRSIEFLF
ncbi:transposase-like zinc-binding domain-containing protein [Intestinibacter sp.]|uniref:transposase-like zinc-binding domain-containing protein n=1 Tax=Intestinibacter sp. TaxID=1965304 RepID=UPI002A9106C6|nr:hypothetical protein [Intestinibacter sp.]MDY5212216.1 hypothetical protein [Intestinibacter sp.]